VLLKWSTTGKVKQSMVRNLGVCQVLQFPSKIKSNQVFHIALDAPRTPLVWAICYVYPMTVARVKVDEDEFQCLELDICMPAQSSEDSSPRKLLHVFIWIHGALHPEEVDGVFSN
jgi:hypothetical protein